MAGNVSSAKAALRREVDARRRALKSDEVKRLGGEVQKRLAALLCFRPELTVGLYAAGPHEVPTQGLFEVARASGARCAYPRAVPGSRVLDFHEVEDTAILVRAALLPVLEPPADAPRVPLEAIDVFVVPGVAFTLRGERLGRGGGHYDTTLAMSPGRRVALAWERSLVDELPVEPTDVPMDVLVTEARVVICRRPLE